ncbi:MAG: DUF3800 domain-containing protein [Candidatus Zixiibacteriota bacterium]
MEKLYCYVDETGQDTKGKFFLVSVVIVGKDRDEIRGRLREIEKASKKGKKKWTQATLTQKQLYINQILTTTLFREAIFYAQYSDAIEYFSLIIKTIAEAISKKVQRDYRATVLIDGLGRPERRRVGSGLRKEGVKVEKVRGLRHGSDEFIRVADAVAGFTRDFFEGKPHTVEPYKEAVKAKVLKEV